MKFTFLVLAMLLMLTACGRREEKQASTSAPTNKPPPSPVQVTNKPMPAPDPSTWDPRLVGTWTWSGAIPGRWPRGGSLTFAPDGTYVSISTNLLATRTNLTIFEGNWGARNDVLVFRYTKTSDPAGMAPDRMDRYRIVSVDEKEL